MAWELACRGGRQSERQFLTANSLSPSTLHMIKGMRQQLTSALIQRGIIADLRSASVNASSGALVRAVLAVGMYPLVGRFLPQCKAPTLATLRGERVRVHAFSVNGKLDVSTLCEPNEDGEKIATLACFDELIRGAHAVQVRECTLVVAAAVVFVCASLSVRPDEPTIDPETGEPCPRPGPPSALLVVDDWLRFRARSARRPSHRPPSPSAQSLRGARRTPETAITTRPERGRAHDRPRPRRRRRRVHRGVRFPRRARAAAVSKVAVSKAAVAAVDTAVADAVFPFPDARDRSTRDAFARGRSFIHSSFIADDSPRHEI